MAISLSNLVWFFKYEIGEIKKVFVWIFFFFLENQLKSKLFYVYIP